MLHRLMAMKDCACILHILVWFEKHGFLKVFVRGLLLCGKTRSYQGLLEFNMKYWGNHALFKHNKEKWHIYYVVSSFLELSLPNYISNMPGYPHFSFWIPISLGKICFFRIVINFAKTTLY